MLISGYCSLIIAGDNLDFDLIEETLGMTADKRKKKGDKSVIGKVEQDIIRFNEKPSGKYNPDKTLKKLSNKLIDNGPFLRELSKKACVNIICFVQSDFAQISYTISEETLKKIGELGIDFEISIFSWGGAEDKREKGKRKKVKERKARERKVKGRRAKGDL